MAERVFHRHAHAQRRHRASRRAMSAAISAKSATSSRRISSLAFPGSAMPIPIYYAASLVSTALGGGMSSRLFQEMREKRGLVYSVYSFASPFSDGGVFGIYAGTGADALPELIPVLAHEIRRLGDGFDKDEFERARAQLKAGSPDVARKHHDAGRTAGRTHAGPTARRSIWPSWSRRSTPSIRTVSSASRAASCRANRPSRRWGRSARSSLTRASRNGSKPEPRSAHGEFEPSPPTASFCRRRAAGNASRRPSPHASTAGARGLRRMGATARSVAHFPDAVGAGVVADALSRSAFRQRLFHYAPNGAVARVTISSFIATPTALAGRHRPQPDPPWRRRIGQPRLLDGRSVSPDKAI